MDRGSGAGDLRELVRRYLTVQPFRRLAPAERDAIEAEAGRLLAFAHPEATERHARIRD